MNIVKAQNMLKGASDEVLQRYLSSPTGEFPEYLVASEIKRREDMRQRYAAEQQGKPSKASIIEEILQKSGLAANPPEQPPAMPQPPMPPEAMGIGSVPPPEGMQMTPPPMLEAMAQAPQRMYDGGVVALAGGGLLDEMEQYLRPIFQERDDAYSGNKVSSAGVNPSVRLGDGSIDINAMRNAMDYGTNYTGRLGATYPIGDGRVSAGISGISTDGYDGVTGYDVGYSEGKNRLMANINPTPTGNAYGINYGHQLDRDSAINAMLMRNPEGQMSGNLAYTKRFDGGGSVDYYKRYQPSDASLYTQEITEVKDLPFYISQAQGYLGPSGVAGYQEALNEQRKEVEGRRKNHLPDFLIQAGLGMATSKNLSPIGAAAEGAAQGFDAYKKSKALDAQAERDLRESEFKFKQAERAERAGVLGVSQKLYESAQTQQNRGIDNNRAAEEMRLTALYRGDQAANDAARLGISRQQLGIQAAGVAREREVAQEQILTSRARRGLIEQQTKYVGVKMPTLKDITTLAESRIGQDALKAIRAAHGVTKPGQDPSTDLAVNQAFQDWLLKNSAKYASPFVGLPSTE
jgi:hypothetical protein